MTGGAKRKWLPAEAYRFLVLRALAHQAGPVSKRTLAWETRANHYMITKVLADLVAQGQVAIAVAGDGDGYAVRLTPQGAAFLDAHDAYFRTTFGDGLAAHFRYGRRPAWAAF